MKTKPVSRPPRTSLAGWLAGLSLVVLAPQVGYACEGEEGFFARTIAKVGGYIGVKPDEEGLPPLPVVKNSVELVLADMDKKNDALVPGYERFESGWYVGPGHTLLGNDPRLKNGGDWFTKSYGTRFDLEKRMTAAMPWILLADGKANQARNVKVQLANVRFYLLQNSTRKWISLGSSRGVAGDFYFKPELARSSGHRSLTRQCDGSTVVGMPQSGDQLFHGWWTKGRIDLPVSPDDIRAIYVSMQGRLVKADAAMADDRDKAEIMMQIGADYYQSREITWNGVPAPAIVGSRLKRLTGDWQAVNALTFNNVGRTDPPGDRGISREEFLQNPPPLN
jgi:hypothetical protein